MRSIGAPRLGQLVKSHRYTALVLFEILHILATSIGTRRFAQEVMMSNFSLADPDAVHPTHHIHRCSSAADASAAAASKSAFAIFVTLLSGALAAAGGGALAAQRRVLIDRTMIRPVAPAVG